MINAASIDARWIAFIVLTTLGPKIGWVAATSTGDHVNANSATVPALITPIARINKGSGHRKHGIDIVPTARVVAKKGNAIRIQ